MKLTRTGLGLLSDGFKPEFLNAHPWLGWFVDIAVVFGSLEIFYFIVKFAVP